MATNAVRECVCSQLSYRLDNPHLIASNLQDTGVEKRQCAPKIRVVSLVTSAAATT